MDAINSSHQDNWENNVYLLATTRVLVALGLTFLVRSVYQLYQRMQTPSRSTGAPGKSRASSCCWKDILADRVQSLERKGRWGLTLRLSPLEH